MMFFFSVLTFSISSFVASNSFLLLPGIKITGCHEHWMTGVMSFGMMVSVEKGTFNHLFTQATALVTDMCSLGERKISHL